MLRRGCDEGKCSYVRLHGCDAECLREVLGLYEKRNRIYFYTDDMTLYTTRFKPIFMDRLPTTSVSAAVALRV